MVVGETFHWLWDCFANPRAETSDKQYSVAERCIAFILWVFFSWVFGSGATVLAFGPLLLFFPIVLMVPLVRYFYITMDMDRRWTLTYGIFCICSVWWMLHLDEWNLGTRVTNTGMIVFEVCNGIMLLLGLVCSRRVVSRGGALVALVSCLAASYYVSDWSPIVREFLK